MNNNRHWQTAAALLLNMAGETLNRFYRAGSHLDLNSNDDGAELSVQLPQNHQLLQSQTAQPGDDTSERKHNRVRILHRCHHTHIHTQNNTNVLMHQKLALPDFAKHLTGEFLPVFDSRHCVSTWDRVIKKSLQLQAFHTPRCVCL